MDEYRDILKQQEKIHAPKLKKQHGLICKQLPLEPDSEVLYLAKPHWTNRFDPDRETTVGIFCAIWVAEELLAKNQFAYNIHSMRLRTLPGYKLTSIKFAQAFRESVASTVANWPNLSMDHGPLTLLQGHDDLSLDTFGENVSARVGGFVEVCGEIDRLMEAGRV